ncbi:phosphoribosylformylglycinamidine synthase [Alkaliphilus serpentinus]|uniref:Phosphoribosylformylglycinamidine synthase n=2 Tax=Alkaliphilus serpentinus TaxID=1482731 RepID=A0A833HNY1_9FIRM|nr:phosphoribosylformylglycinamidine synthase [Alkaliphilus serpentinus]KAB3530084.1 phosphoribosylformylglycinamidine synthase [Alkaliphilus serpentinus]
MENTVRRIYVEKKPGYDVEAQHLFFDLKKHLKIKNLAKLRLINCYDIAGISQEVYQQARSTIFSEATIDFVYDENLEIEEGTQAFAMEYLPGQYDQRADSAAQCIQILTQGEAPTLQTSQVIVLYGDISYDEINRIKGYCINPVDSREAPLEKPQSIKVHIKQPDDVSTLEGFIELKPHQLTTYKEKMDFVMSIEDLEFCQSYFRDEEKRNPTLTEMKVIDTYWSDHCRHTTFLTSIDKVTIEKKHFGEAIDQAYKSYLRDREYVYGDEKRPITLMDIAVMGMKRLKKEGKLKDLDLSDEINACSIVVEAEINGTKEDWLVMFKNETHNHPTEIEPFGGAATCLGGAIRDPLSGRVYVYQAMRVTGSGDPRKGISETLAGKLPQRKITTGAAAGYSSYGNQIGLATGHVSEIYDEGFVAKRMEIGAVIGAAPKANVVRRKPVEGDVVILLGGRTGRDGCGGATGSSVEHTEDSILTCGAEVQKGNPPTERKIQRLFRNPNASRLIKKCNDFGAGGVSVAIGELTDGLDINLDAIPKKYEGLDGTELAISESQERMAVVVSNKDAQEFINLSAEENLEAVIVAKVTSLNRLRMTWRDKLIVDISRDFLNTNGVEQHTEVYVKEPSISENYFSQRTQKTSTGLRQHWLDNLKNINIASKKGLIERFDSTVGSGTLLMPFGGKYQGTPTEGMAAKLPVESGDTTTGTLMTYGYNPKIGKWSPFHGGLYAIIEAVAKVVAMGGNHENTRLSLQEYFEKLGSNPEKWGKPFSALLGAHYAQMELGIPAIGGKDSMSGTFKDLNVPPTLVAFTATPVDIRNIITPELKGCGNTILLIPIERDFKEIPKFKELKRVYHQITKLIGEEKIISAYTIGQGGLAASLSKMAFGNGIGVSLSSEIINLQKEKNLLFSPDYGSLLVEVPKDVDIPSAFIDISYITVGTSKKAPTIEAGEMAIDLMEAQRVWEEPLEDIFPTKIHASISRSIETLCYHATTTRKPSVRLAKPRVLIPVFPGTNCEYDVKKVFQEAGGKAETFIFRNVTSGDIEASIKELSNRIDSSQIIMLPGGFSGGDEPDGSGKFIATVFRNPRIAASVMELLNKRNGLILGICNGFQALIKLGLLPYGEIREINEGSPTLTFNEIGRHISCITDTRIASNLSPWLSNVKVGDIHGIPVSHGEGRFVANEIEMQKLIDNGQIATQYVDPSGKATYDIGYNPNGSYYAVEGITSPDGRILGKMGHSERIGKYLYKNIPQEKDQKLFQSGVEYFS